MTHYEKTEKTNRIFDGKVIKLDLLKVRLENGKLAEREIVTHPGGVGIVAVTEDKELYLVKQFRKPYDEEVLEIPAGKLEKGERPELCAQRELKEETGLTAASFTLLTEMYPSPGYTDEIIRIFKAEDLNQGEIELDEDEFLDVYKIKLEDAVGMIKRGEIKDAKTIIGVLMIASEM